ncbi:MAG: phosphodiester glycosidase family protein [Clostridia bacterium]|nr:phosphodiester glycosidase family protein [Clostridia bacterium]
MDRENDFTLDEEFWNSVNEIVASAGAEDAEDTHGETPAATPQKHPEETRPEPPAGKSVPEKSPTEPKRPAPKPPEKSPFPPERKPERPAREEKSAPSKDPEAEASRRAFLRHFKKYVKVLLIIAALGLAVMYAGAAMFDRIYASLGSDLDAVDTETVAVQPTPEPTPIPGLLGNKYKEKFADGQPFSTEPNTSETLADGTTRTLIYTFAGKNAAFELYQCTNGKIKYQVADVYVRDISKLTAAFEKDQNKTKKIRAFAEESGVLIAVSSDYFAANANDEGLIIRNGFMIRSNPCRHSDLCVIYQDGTMRCFDCKKDKIDNNEILGSYPYHSFYFGPSLLDENGAAKTQFNSSLSGPNPRSVIGYYEPGHYAFISVLGDYNMIDYNGKNLGNSGSPGMTFAELSTLCASMGMKAAYNLDGGRSIGMYWNGKLFGHNMRAIGDIIAVTD